MSIGTPRVMFTPPGGAAVDVTCFVDSLTIHHGRDDAESQPDAGTCTFEISPKDYAPELPVVDVGHTVAVNVTVGGANIARWAGTVTDVSQGWDDAGEQTPDRPVMQVIAASVLSILGRRVVGDVPWAQELDGSRVAKILTAAGIGWNANYSDPGTVQILARDVDAQPALDLAQQVAADAGGILWETKTNTVRYADAMHRRNTPAKFEFDACDILVTPTWQRSTAGLVNDVSLGYGPTPSDGEQPHVRDTRPNSIAQWGTWALSAATQLAALADASSMVGMILARNSQPAWVMTALPLDVKSLSDADTQTILNLEMHDLVLLNGLPAAGGAPTTAYLWVEGWEEKLEFGNHEITLAVSGFCRTTPPPLWDDVPPEYTWDSMGSTTWDDATCLGPQPPRGRWNDIPATTRWNTVMPANVTWDNAGQIWGN